MHKTYNTNTPVRSANKRLAIQYFRYTETLNTTVRRNDFATRLTITNTLRKVGRRLHTTTLRAQLIPHIISGP